MTHRVPRMARGDEGQFIGGPLDGSYDWTPPQQLTLEWLMGNSWKIHVYIRGITGDMIYQGCRKGPGQYEREDDGA